MSIRINKNKSIIAAALILQLSVFNFSSADVTGIVPTPTPTQLPTQPLLTVPNIITKIKEAKALLASVNLSYNLVPRYSGKKKKKVLSSYQLQSKEIVLAILDPASNKITLATGTQSGSGRSMSFNDPNVNVKLVTFNGVNSRYQINSPANGVIVAEKYMISVVESGSKNAIVNGLSQIIYVPYSQGLGNNDVYAYGANYLTNVINTVARDLQGMPSNSVPGKSITEAIPPSMIKALIYAEHTSYAASNMSEAQNSFNQLNVLFAANEADTYKYSVSNDGYYSRGISQFIEPTYESLVHRHGNSGLIGDYKTAMADHRNAIKAMYLLIDDYAGDVRVRAPSGFTSGRVFDYGAAAYNGGTTRVARAVEDFGQNWNADRNGQAHSLENEVNALNRQASGLKKQIKKTKDSAAKAALRSTLAQVQGQISSDNDQIDKVYSSTLRGGTINYLNKIYSVIQYFNQQQI
ncbi:MAG: hypothetical protein NVSMB66_6680 [Candidatus Doudnabacteria bacterium]